MKKTSSPHLGGNPIDWQLALAPASTDHFTLKEQYELFINGKWQKPRSGTRSALRQAQASGAPYFYAINPANEAAM
ncbi:MAG: hypothetical protein JST38_21400 [Bacteroidetes bacterium]|nr:hypothetical protein [Bacteroidota bacterium]